MPAEQTDTCVVATTQELPDSVSALDRTKEAEWGLLPYATLAKDGSELARQTTLLFLTEPAYEVAMAELNDAQIAEVVRKRLADPAAYLAVMVEAQGEKAGELAAQATAARPARGKQREAWDAIVASALRAQLTCYRTGLLADFDQDEITTMIGWRASLLTAERELAKTKGASAAMKQAAAAAAEAYDASFRELAQILADLGDSTYTELPARDTKTRLVWVTSDNPVIRPKVAGYGLPAWPWNKGLLVPITAEQLDALPKIGPPVILYMSTGDYTTAQRLSTRAQLELDLRRRYDNGGPTTAERVQHIVSRRLSLVAHLGVLSELAAAAAGGKEAALQLIAVRDRELELVAPFLSCLERWGSKGRPAAEQAGQLLAELKVLAPYCRAAGEEELATCVTEMTKDLENLAAQWPRPAKK